MWALKDKNGKYRSRRSFKQDLKQDSEEEWEIRRRNQHKQIKVNPKKPTKKPSILDQAWREINKK